MNPYRSLETRTSHLIFSTVRVWRYTNEHQALLFNNIKIVVSSPRLAQIKHLSFDHSLGMRALLGHAVHLAAQPDEQARRIAQSRYLTCCDAPHAAYTSRHLCFTFARRLYVSSFSVELCGASGRIGRPPPPSDETSCRRNRLHMTTTTTETCCRASSSTSSPRQRYQTRLDNCLRRLWAPGRAKEPSEGLPTFKLR